MYTCQLLQCHILITGEGKRRVKVYYYICDIIVLSHLFTLVITDVLYHIIYVITIRYATFCKYHLGILYRPHNNLYQLVTPYLL